MPLPTGLKKRLDAAKKKVSPRKNINPISQFIKQHPEIQEIVSELKSEYTLKGIADILNEVYGSELKRIHYVARTPKKLFRDRPLPEDASIEGEMVIFEKQASFRESDVKKILQQIEDERQSIPEIPPI